MKKFLLKIAFLMGLGALVQRLAPTLKNTVLSKLPHAPSTFNRNPIRFPSSRS